MRYGPALDPGKLAELVKLILGILAFVFGGNPSVKSGSHISLV
jgi:hypothetical protein